MANALRQCTGFVEDLFFHESHVQGLRTLLQHDRVAFSVRRNPLTVRFSLAGLGLCADESCMWVGGKRGTRVVVLTCQHDVVTKS